MRRRARATVLAVTAVIGLALVGCSSSSANGAPFSVPGKAVTTDHVEAPRSYRFDPAVIQVQPGTEVTWTNHDEFPHTIQLLTGSDRSTRDLGIGKTVTIRFDQPGQYYYRCSLHPAQMHGEVIVK